MSVSFQDLDPELQKQVGGKPGATFTVAVACLASLFFPLILMMAKEVFIDRPKERVDLVYDITQPREHPANEIITYIEVENVGRKGASDAVVLEVEFRAPAVKYEWKRKPDPANILSEEVVAPGSLFRLKLKNLDPTAKVGILFQSGSDLAKLPLLKHNEVLYPPRVRSTLERYTP
jgi:hypothetical protein